MRMSNYIGLGTLHSPVMAATRSPPAGHRIDDPSDRGVGMAHLTVVPTNFDPEDVADS